MLLLYLYSVIVTLDFHFRSFNKGSIIIIIIIIYTGVEYRNRIMSFFHQRSVRFNLVGIGIALFFPILLPCQYFVIIFNEILRTYTLYVHLYVSRHLRKREGAKARVCF